MNISLIIFGYNEAGSLPDVADKAFVYLERFSEKFEIIIIDDGSSDGTSEIADNIKTIYPDIVTVVHHPNNLGIGMALRSGYSRAKLDYVCAIPADGQFPINQFDILKPFDQSTFYSFYRLNTRYSFYRYILTWANRLFNQHILGVFLRDVNWIKVYRKEHLQMTKPELKSSLIESEICAKLYKLGIMPIEVPSDYLERVYGIPKGGAWSTLKKAMTETWALLWIVHTFHPQKNTQE